MNSLRKSIALFLALPVAGCAIHPLPENVTGVSTYEIVRRIRCEAREGVIDSLRDYFEHGEIDAASRATGLRFVGPDAPISGLDPKLFKGEVHDILAMFWTTGVAYNFTLDMTEQDGATAGADFLRTFSNGTLGLGLGAGVSGSRENTRTFTVTDTFGGLAKKPMDCADRIVAENYVYPITGKIGVERMIHAFVYLSLFGNLGGKGPPTLVDDLIFTTNISGSATPKVTFAPFGKAFSLADANISAQASRQDKHQVTIALALDSVPAPQIGQVRDQLIGRLLTASGSRSELAAANAIDQFQTRKMFSPVINVSP